MPSSSTQHSTIVSTKKGFLGKKKSTKTSSGQQNSVLNFTWDPIPVIQPHKDFLPSELLGIHSFTDPETVKQVKKLLRGTNRAVSFYNSNFFDRAYEVYESTLRELVELVEDLNQKKMFTIANIVAQTQEPHFGSWTIRLAMHTLVDITYKDFSPIHICCTPVCGDHYVLVNLLRVDKKFRTVFPLETETPNEDSMPVDINIRTTDKASETPLHLACRYDKITGPALHLVHILLRAGADVNTIDGNGNTPLSIALQGQHHGWPLCALLCSEPALSTIPPDDLLPMTLNFAALGMNSFPESITLMASRLEMLDLSRNSIAALPNALSLLIHLKTLILSDMNLRTFPTSLFPCTKLEVLDLSKNLISHIPAHIECLTELKTLKLKNNKLNSLPSSLSKLPRLQKINVEKNPLESIPKEVLARGTSSLKSYLAQMEGQTSNWKRIKLLVLGEEATGKTSLLSCFQLKNKTKKNFKKRNNKTLSTDGLEVNYWQANTSVEFQTWDFAGQQVFYPTHQFFLSSRCIYIVTFNTINVNAARPKYWVRQIGAVAKDKPPIFLVGTHIDDPSCNETSKLSAKAKLKGLINFQKYNVVDCLFISSKTGEGIKELSDTLTTTAMDHHMLKQLVPGNYLTLDKLLGQERTKHQWVRWSMYLKWLLQCGIDKKDLPVVTNFLHDVGSLIYFQNNPALRDIIILDPQWLADVFSSLITFNHQWIKDGVLKSEDLGQVWKQYPRQLHPKLLTLLTKFGVASPLRDDIKHDSISSLSSIATQYIIPSLLKETKPNSALVLFPPSCKSTELEFSRLYSFSFSFDFSKILLALLHAENLNVDCFWRNGILVRDICNPGNQHALIQWHPNQSQLKFMIRIDVTTFRMFQKLQLLRQITELVDTILEGFYGGCPYVTRQVACSHCLAQRSSLLEGVYYFGLDALVDAVGMGQWIVYCRGVPTRPVDIRYIAPDIAFCDFPVIPESSYSIIKEVGRGGFGVVYFGDLQGTDVAIKELLLCTGEESLDASSDGETFRKFAEFQQEVYVMSALDHINLVRLFGVSINPLRMIMEWCGSGDLWHLLHPNENTQNIPPPKLSYKMAFDIACGVQFLQEVTPPIVHRDLRSPNIFLVSTNENDPVCAKVADFGLSRHVENFLGETLPTWRWLAPEVINFESQHYDERSDIYSFAIVLWELVTAEIPYEEYEEMSVLDIRKGIISGRLRPTIPCTVDKRYATVIRQCWRSNPQDRLSMKEAVSILADLLGGKIDLARSYRPSDAVHRDLIERIRLPQLISVPESIPEEEGVREVTPVLLAMKENLRDSPVTSMIAVGSHMWCGFGDGYISVFDCATQSLVAAFAAFVDSEVFCLLATSVGTVWAGSSSIKIFKVDSFQKKKTIPTKEVVLAMSIVHVNETETIWSADFQGHLVVWNNTGSTVLHRVKIGEPVYCLQQYGDKVWIGLYRKLLIYSALTASLYATGDTNQLRTLLVCGNEMWGALNDNFVFVWDTESISIIHSLEGHTGTLSCIASVGDFIWTGAFDTTILLWNPKTHKCVSELSGFHKGRILAIAHADPLVWTSGEDNTICIWEMK